MIWTFWLYAACAAPWTACLLTYGLRSPWRRSWVGRAMFTTYGALAAVLGLAALLRVVRLPVHIAITLAVATLTAVGIAGVVQLVNIVRLQRRDPSAPHRRSTDR